MSRGAHETRGTVGSIAWLAGILLPMFPVHLSGLLKQGYDNPLKHGEASECGRSSAHFQLTNIVATVPVKRSL